MRRYFRICVILFVLGALACASFIAFSFAQYNRSYDAATFPQSVVIARGTPLKHIFSQLRDAQLVPHIYMIGLPLWLSDNHQGLKAGEYLFTEALSPKDVIAKLRNGDVVQHKITLVEGWNARQLREALMNDDRLTGALPEVIAEGSALPETYQFLRGDARADILKQMQRAMDNALAELWANRAPDLPLKTPEEALVLASIVERETGVKQERARVAAVFINRIRAGMRLQSDPTAVYGIEQQTGAPLGRLPRAKDMDVDTPWNTYTRDGLPPTPIASPGRKALAATVNPLETNEFYFVATGDGGHFFARSLREHNRNVAKYRQVRRAQERAR